MKGRVVLSLVGGVGLWCAICLGAVTNLPAQTAPEAATASAVPHWVRFSGVLTDAAGKPLRGEVAITFSLYRDAEGGEPLWQETLSVQADEKGNYAALLGSSQPEGLPAGIFTSGEARWLGEEAPGQTTASPRTLLVSVPYAVKAEEAERLEGRPASDFVLAESLGAAVQNVLQMQTATAPTARSSASRNSTMSNSPAVPPQLSTSGQTLFTGTTAAPSPLVEIQQKGTGDALLLQSHLAASASNYLIHGQAGTTPADVFDVDTHGNIAKAGAGSFSGNTTTPVVSVKQSGNGNGINAITASTTTGTGAIAGTATGNGLVAGVAGIYSGNQQGAGIFGEATSAKGQAGLFRNIVGGPGLRVENAGGTESVFDVESSGTVSVQGNVEISGTLNVSGSKHAVQKLPDGRNVALNALETPESWFEDLGSGTLQHGVATIKLDPTFAQTVNTGIEYLVFLTPSGNCRGLYVAERTPLGFQVRELKKGKSNVTFDYRIVAHRRGFEKERLEEITPTRASF